MLELSRSLWCGICAPFPRFFSYAHTLVSLSFSNVSLQGFTSEVLKHIGDGENNDKEKWGAITHKYASRHDKCMFYK
jgi:hypothetical protein